MVGLLKGDRVGSRWTGAPDGFTLTRVLSFVMLHDYPSIVKYFNQVYSMRIENGGLMEWG